MTPPAPRQPMKERRKWTKTEERVLRAKYPHMATARLLPLFPGRSITMLYQHAAVLGLKKSAAYLATPEAGRLRGDTGSAHRFQKGHKTWNAGMKGWQAGGRSKATQFKKGNYSKRWDRKVYCIGALRINADGGLDIKVREGLRGWEAMARYVWRTERGPIPSRAVVRFANGDTHDTRIANLRLGSKADVMRENTYHNYPKEIARLIQLRGALQRQLNKREQHG